MTNVIINKIETFLKPLDRKRRALVDSVGKISKWLSGTLDIDDEKYINKYLNNLKNNENKIHNDLYEFKSTLSEITKKYTETFKALSENQITLQKQILLLSKEINEVLKIEQAFSITIMLDNLILQLQNIQNLINNVEIAISLGKSNILHSSIIEPKSLKELITKSNNLYKQSEIPKLRNFKNYYNVFSTQVMIRNSLIIFKIHAP